MKHHSNLRSQSFSVVRLPDHEAMPFPRLDSDDHGLCDNFAPIVICMAIMAYRNSDVENFGSGGVWVKAQTQDVESGLLKPRYTYSTTMDAVFVNL